MKETEELREQALADAEDLRGAIGRLVRLVREGETLPSNQAAVLGHLVRDGALPIVELARRERVRHQSMARTVALLDSAKLVSLSQDQEDRRRIVVEASELGISTLKEARRIRSGALADAIENVLPVAERGSVRDVVEFLNRLADSMNLPGPT
ncbi:MULTISPECIES: MarR family winged helix-turn-helix transcriptional regulator [unclassified Streptomyces]|uniref:MarR family winged helix-turn-helix transcriptional regulator n=1 Tax=unclassified Streptomyces TaxID=2593676 RepID=UPI002E2111C7